MQGERRKKEEKEKAVYDLKIGLVSTGPWRLLLVRCRGRRTGRKP